jgi:hypothetical protein
MDGNAFAIMALCRRAAKEAGLPSGELEAFLEEAMAGDYDHLLETCRKYFEVE